MIPEQAIKAQLALLSVFLQAPIPDAVLLLYARDLHDLGSEGLATAIEALKRDETLWTGKFPLPARIRAYLTGTIEERSALSARRILDIGRDAQGYCTAKNTLSALEFSVACEYGLQAIMDRSPGQTPTIYAQLRDLMRATYIDARKTQLLLEMEMKRGLPGNLETVRKEIARTEEVSESAGEGADIRLGQGRDHEG